MRHLVSAEIDPGLALHFLETADHFREHRSPAKFSGEAVLLFYEPSTRTRLSFEFAARRLGLHPAVALPGDLSVQKGEGPEETLKTMAALGARTLVVRTAEEGLPARLADLDLLPVVNAGDGRNEHPTQALLDLYTLRRAFGEDLEGLTLTIVGDILHSRVARSDLRLLPRFGVRVRLAGPPTLVPPAFAETFGVEVYHDLDAALDGADAVMALRIQRERQAGDLVPPVEVYRRDFGLDQRRLGDRYLMHPGPANLGVEVEPALVDGPRSLVREQVRNGVFVRMAVLAWILDEAEVYA